MDALSTPWPVERSVASIAQGIADRLRALGVKAEVSEEGYSGAEVAICIGGQHPTTRVPKTMRIWFEFCHALDLDIAKAQQLLERLNEAGVTAKDAMRILAVMHNEPWVAVNGRAR